LETFFHNDDQSRINQEYAPKLAKILDRLDASVRHQDMNLPSYKLPILSGKERGLGQFGLPAIGESLFSLMDLMQ
jgi:proteic killer suppression protein